MNDPTRFSTKRRRLSAALTAMLLMQWHCVPHADYAVKVGAFADREPASQFNDSLNAQGFPATASPADKNSNNLTQIRGGPYPDRASAEETHSRLEQLKIASFLMQIPASGDTAPANTNIILAAREDSEPESGNSMDELFGMETDEAIEDNSVGGFFNSKYAYTTASPTHHSMFRNTLELRANGRINSGISWKASARGSYDAVFDIDNFYSSRVEDNRRFEGAIHETYLDISKGDWDFRLGRQHIIWGEMVGLFFADVVSAKDTRQWVAEDFDMIRIPQWAARAERYMGDIHAEAIWIPFMTYDEIGKPGDDFYPLGTDPLPGFNQKIRNDNQPTQELSNSAYGMRLSMLKSGWDLSGFYYRSMDASPTFFRTIETGPTPTITYSPDHKKIHQLGATMAKDLGNFLVKGEAIYTRDRRFIIDDLNDADGVKKQNPLDYVIGLEYTTPGNTILNFQFFQRWYTNHDSDLLFDEFESGASFYASTDFTSRLTGELLLISSLNREDWMFRPKLKWDMTGNWQLVAGADIFGGERKGLIGGRFDNSDRLYGQVRYTF